MPVFDYRALNGAGKQVSGLKEADSPKGLRAALRKDGLFLTEVVGTADARPATAGKGSKGPARGAAALAARSQDVDLRKLAGGRVTTDDIAITTRQLATLLGAGVTLVEALTALVDQIEKERLKRVVSDVKQRVNEGSSLADALQQHQKIFGSLYVNMIRAGEHSGALDAVLLRLADFTESQSRLQQKVIGTLAYPAIMAVMGGGILTLLMAVVVPKVTKIFDTMKATLPWTTQLLIWSSNMLADWWFVLLPALVAAGVAFVAWTRSEAGRPTWDRQVLKMPVFGSLVRMLAISRFARTLATLLKSGVPLLTAMDIVRNVVTNSVLAGVVENARDAVREGESFSAPLRRSGQFPPLVYHMVAIGEKSGQLEDMLVSVADSYEQQVNIRIAALTSLLEPVVTILMGSIIAFVAFSILMPILQINSSIR
jgi:general secretion pathway protein F